LGGRGAAAAGAFAYEGPVILRTRGNRPIHGLRSGPGGHCRKIESSTPEAAAAAQNGRNYPIFQKCLFVEKNRAVFSSCPPRHPAVPYRNPPCPPAHREEPVDVPTQTTATTGRRFVQVSTPPLARLARPELAFGAGFTTTSRSPTPVPWSCFCSPARPPTPPRR
jgi:hypothetical protein